MGGHGKHIMALTCNGTFLVYVCVCVWCLTHKQGKLGLSIPHLIFYCTAPAALTAESVKCVRETEKESS